LAVFDPFLPGFVVKKQGVKAMSIMQWPNCNGKVVSNISLTQPFPGGKKEYEVRIQFNDGTGLNLKSESIITIEEVINVKYK
jgi:hypothetical protein